MSDNNELRELLRKQGFDDYTIDLVYELTNNKIVKKFVESAGPDSDTTPRVVLKDLLENIIFDMRTEEQALNLLSFLFHISKDPIFSAVIIELRDQNF